MEERRKRVLLFPLCRDKPIFRWALLNLPDMQNPSEISVGEIQLALDHSHGIAEKLVCMRSYDRTADVSPPC